MNLDCNQLFLEHLRSSDPEAHHVVIAAQAGFHLRKGYERLSEGVHIVPLPPYSPELNPCEQLWHDAQLVLSLIWSPIVTVSSKRYCEKLEVGLS